MPITSSAKRALRKSIKNRTANAKIKKELKGAIKTAQNLISQKKAEAGKAVSLAYSKIDKAAKKRIFSKQRAARLKANLAKNLAKSKIKIEKREIVVDKVKKVQKVNKVDKVREVAKPEKIKKATTKKKPVAKKSATKKASEGIKTKIPK